MFGKSIIGTLVIYAFMGVMFLVMFKAGEEKGAAHPNDQIRADIYFAGQAEASQACKGEMHYE